MTRLGCFVGAACAAALIGLIWSAPASAAGAGGLVVDGMQNFTVHPAPRPVPTLNFVDGDGAERILSDFAGPVILLNIWATWCGPCRVEMPSLDRLQAELGGDDFMVLPLSIDRAGMEKVTEFYEDVGLKYIQRFLDQTTKSARALKTFALPTTVLIDGSGQELGRMIGPAEWDSPETLILMRHFIAEAGS